MPSCYTTSIGKWDRVRYTLTMFFRFFVLKNFNACLYDLLILDIKMIQMNGLDLYREIKNVDARVKACFLTALSDLEEYEDFKKEVFTEGERYSVVKPIDNEEMLKRANEMITVND